MQNINLLLIGSGGREHALAYKLAQSPLLGTLYCSPGNAGMAAVSTLVELNIDDHKAVIAFCQQNNIGLVVVGPEAPLVAGLVDALDAANIPAFGPSASAAQLEGSKGFTKDICKQYNIPTAAYQRFDDEAKAIAYIKQQGAPIVVKADGLAAGKGVTVASTIAEAVEAVEAMFGGAFGEAGVEVVIEDCMVGEEASLFALSDGKNALFLAHAQDHKRAYDGDNGPNTGGMGAYSPAPVMTPELVETTMETIIKPTLQAMQDKGTPFKGVLYAGLMLTKDGPQLIEYNARFGDPETQVLMMRLQSDLLPLLMASAKGDLSEQTPQWRTETALTVVMAARGYPGDYAKGTVIEGVDDANTLPDTVVFHAGTKQVGNQLQANGGRVLNVSTLGTSVKDAQDRAYLAVNHINWPEGFCRRDIGWRAVERELGVEERVKD